MPAQPLTNILGSAVDAFAITPSDSANFAVQARGIFVGGAGNISLVTQQGTTVMLVGCVAGSVLQIRSMRINSTGTTATNLVGLV